MNKTVIYILIGIILIILLSTIISIINRIKYLHKNVERSKCTIDVYLKKRFDLIPNLVEVVKGYMNYEKGTLDEITKLRNSYNERIDVNSGTKLNEHFKKLIATVESYPEIKAGENFLQLQKTLTKVESEIEATRRIFISDITRYNTYIESFPKSIFAKLTGYKKIDLPKFEFEEVNIKFD